MDWKGQQWREHVLEVVRARNMRYQKALEEIAEGGGFAGSIAKRALTSVQVENERGPWWAGSAAPIPKVDEVMMWPDLGGGGHMYYWRVTRVEGREWWMVPIGPIAQFQGQFEYRGE